MTAEISSMSARKTKTRVANPTIRSAAFSGRRVVSCRVWASSRSSTRHWATRGSTCGSRPRSSRSGRARARGPVVTFTMGTTNAPISATERKESWKLASKSCAGSQRNEADGDRRQHVQNARAPVENAGDGV